MDNPITPALEAVQRVESYHERTKHRLERYAAGPETLDWDAQPNPFREFSGTSRITLPFATQAEGPGFSGCLDLPARAIDLQSIGQLLQWSFGLAAWKEYGQDRWALRCNPSSGNLHPTEAYVWCQGALGLEDGLYHYLSRDHVLEQRRSWNQDQGPSRLCIALTSIHWREAWKYGERALRYCYLDIGHAIGALRYAALTLGWRLRLRTDVGGQQLREFLGLDRSGDFGSAETESPELMLEIVTDPDLEPARIPPPQSGNGWSGTANQLDARHLYQWPIIGDTAQAAILPGLMPEPSVTEMVPAHGWNSTRIPAGRLILGRRSAQRFDRNSLLPAEDFFAILDALLPRAAPPLDFWPWPARIHPLLLVHRIDGLEPGLYILPRNVSSEAFLQASLSPSFAWASVPEAPPHMPIRCLYRGDLRKLSHLLCCHQAIAADSHFAVIFLAEYASSIRAAAYHYPLLFFEAGLLGHLLYMEAEMHGISGTGIGCFFDDAVHDILGIVDTSFQSLYHFTVGRALVDGRIKSTSPYTAKEPDGGDIHEPAE